MAGGLQEENTDDWLLLPELFKGLHGSDEYKPEKLQCVAFSGVSLRVSNKGDGVSGEWSLKQSKYFSVLQYIEAASGSRAMINWPGLSALMRPAYWETKIKSIICGYILLVHAAQVLTILYNIEM